MPERVDGNDDERRRSNERDAENAATGTRSRAAKSETRNGPPARAIELVCDARGASQADWKQEQRNQQHRAAAKETRNLSNEI